MPSLASLDARFAVRFDILEGGSGSFRGVITEPNQSEAPAYLFNLPRRLLRVSGGVPLGAGRVVRDPSGAVFMVGDHGESERSSEIVFRSYRLFEATGRYSWQRREKTIDPINQLERDSGLVNQPAIWGCYEPAQEAFDRQIRVNFETARFITASAIQRDDIVDGKQVTRVDVQLGLRLATLG